ncbi:MAG: DMT family transporter [Oscillospiraceae bacterium]|nr:DMT family transporter [Oscillospiraceae bacterium]
MSEDKKVHFKHGRTHLFMVLLILIWAIDSVTISMAMDSVNQVFLVCAKYAFALPIVILVVAIRHGIRLPRRKDIVHLLVSALFGDVLYFFFEYTALKYLSVSMVTILLGFLPVASYLTDCVVQRRKPDWLSLLAIGISIFGLVLVVSTKTEEQGNSVIGYLCCAACLAVWIVYGYLTRSMESTYNSTTITMYQMVFAFGMMLPIALTHFPSSLFSRDFWISIVLMGILSSGIGCLIEVKGLIDLGTTISGIYLNLLPVFTAMAGVIFLHERMTLIQCIGSILIIVCGFIVEKRDQT